MNDSAKQNLRVLLIEDSENDAELIARELNKANGFILYLEVATNIREIITKMASSTWDIIITDYNLGSFDAMKVIDILEDMELDIPLILISGVVDLEQINEAFRKGAHEFVSKQNLSRLHAVIKRELKINLAYEETLKAWARTLDIRDHVTAGHSERVVNMTLLLSRAMGLAESDIVHIRRGALLHDIGKLIVPDAILNKPGKLTHEELLLMRQHTETAYELLKDIAFLRKAMIIPRYHHERWDGSGYPFGLQGRNISLPARIFAVVDVWDAMTNTRPYREALSHKFVIKYLYQQKGILFDPNVVDKFIELFDEEEGS
jgi:response regulator RpfG family c-di-GMP phosphodiesterase